MRTSLVDKYYQIIYSQYLLKCPFIYKNPQNQFLHVFSIIAKCKSLKIYLLPLFQYFWLKFLELVTIINIISSLGVYFFQNNFWAEPRPFLSNIRTHFCRKNGRGSAKYRKNSNITEKFYF